MEVTVSSKYQVVIPKTIRRNLGIKPGQKLEVDKTKGDKITFSRSLSSDEYFNKYVGSIKTADTAWGKAGIDAAEWLRKQRDEEWD